MNERSVLYVCASETPPSASSVNVSVTMSAPRRSAWRFSSYAWRVPFSPRRQDAKTAEKVTLSTSADGHAAVDHDHLASRPRARARCKKNRGPGYVVRLTDTA